MRTNAYVKFLNSGQEGRAYSTINSPKGLLNAIIQALEFHGAKRGDIEARVDLDALEKQLAGVDTRAFRALLNFNEYHPLQLILSETQERIPQGSMTPTADRGTLHGPAH